MDFVICALPIEQAYPDQHLALNLLSMSSPFPFLYFQNFDETTMFSVLKLSPFNKS